MIVLNGELNLRAGDHTYWKDGVRVPGVSEILKHFGFYFYPRGIEFQMDRGKEAHRCLHILSRGGQLDPFTMDPAVEPYVRSWERLRDRLDFRVIQSEALVYNALRRYAGTLDAVWELDGVEVLVDYKTGDVIPATELQLGAYDECLKKNARRRRAAVRLMGDGSEARIEWMKEKQAGGLFNGLAANYHFKMSQGLIRIAA